MHHQTVVYVPESTGKMEYGLISLKTIKGIFLIILIAPGIIFYPLVIIWMFSHAMTDLMDFLPPKQQEQKAIYRGGLVK